MRRHVLIEPARGDRRAVAAGRCGCRLHVGPNYKRPPIDGARTHFAARDAGRRPSAPRRSPTSAWSTLFEDEALRELITTALAQNYDLRIAASRILQAQAQLGITRADQFPTVDAPGASARGSTARSSAARALPTGRRRRSSARRLSWELDFWGRFRRATEAARAQIWRASGGAARS